MFRLICTVEYNPFCSMVALVPETGHNLEPDESNTLETIMHQYLTITW